MSINPKKINFFSIKIPNFEEEKNCQKEEKKNAILLVLPIDEICL